MHHPTDRIIHTTAFGTPVVEHWLGREIAQWVHHEGSIRWLIAPWVNALTTELHWHIILTFFHNNCCIVNALLYDLLTSSQRGHSLTLDLVDFILQQALPGVKKFVDSSFQIREMATDLVTTVFGTGRYLGSVKNTFINSKKKERKKNKRERNWVRKKEKKERKEKKGSKERKKKKGKKEETQEKKKKKKGNSTSSLKAIWVKNGSIGRSYNRPGCGHVIG